MRRTTLSLLGLAAAIGVMLAPITATAESGSTELDVEIDGTPLAEASSTDPIVLDPDRPVILDVTVTNLGEQVLDGKTIRLEGTVAGLPFFAFETALAISVEPGSTETRQFQLDLAAVDGQAVGLLPAEVQLLDADRDVVATEAAVVDVRGSVASVYGVWALAAAVFCAIQLIQLGLAVARHRLPANRWRRGVRFAALGTTFGMLIVFGLSALRIVAPHGSIWVPVVGGISLVLFVLGYVSPFLDDDDVDDDDGEGRDDLFGPEYAGYVSRDVRDTHESLEDESAIDPRATNKVAVRLHDPRTPANGDER